MLEVSNLKKSFGGIKAVDDCSFKIKENSITALIGPNGSGKTTVFNIISGILKADSGKVRFNKKIISERQPHEISNMGFSRLFQQSRLFDHLSVKENLRLALSNEDTNLFKSLFKHFSVEEEDKKILKLAKIMEIELFMNKLTKNLSYGQKRLVEIARAILNPHKILILDEPTAGVNPKLRKEITKILLNLKKRGDTILFIEHDLNFTLKIAEEIIVLDEGKIIAQGKPNEIKNNKKVLEAYLGE